MTPWLFVSTRNLNGTILGNINILLLWFGFIRIRGELGDWGFTAVLDRRIALLRALRSAFFIFKVFNRLIYSLMILRRNGVLMKPLNGRVDGRQCWRESSLGSIALLLGGDHLALLLRGGGGPGEELVLDLVLLLGRYS